MGKESIYFCHGICLLSHFNAHHGNKLAYSHFCIIRLAKKRETVAMVYLNISKVEHQNATLHSRIFRSYFDDKLHELWCISIAEIQR